MWRPLARRASLYRRTVAPRLRPTLLHQTPTLQPPSLQSASRFSIFSRLSRPNPNPRFFSSSPAEIEPVPPPEPPATAFDFDAPKVFDEMPQPESENEDAIFDDAVGGFDVEKGFGEILDGPVENLGDVVAEDEGVGEVKKNEVEKVEDLLSLLQSSGGAKGSLESKLDGMGLVLDEGLVSKVIETPYVPGENLIGFVKWAIKKPEFKLSTVMVDAFVSAVCNESTKREAYDLLDLVNEIGEKEKGVFSTENLNALIGELSRLGKGMASYHLFKKFEEFGCSVNGDTCYMTIEVLCRRSFYDWACSVCEKMLNEDKLPDAERVGKIISYLCKGGMTKDAHLVYLCAKDKKISPPQSSTFFLISSLSRIKKTDKKTDKEISKEVDKETVSLALEMLNDYSVEDRKYAINPFSSVIKKLCWIEDVDRAKKLLLEMVESGPPPGNAVFNCVINGLTKNGDMVEALNMLKLMEKRGLKPDVYTYSVIMSGYARDGEMEEACKIFDQAKKKHSKLTPVTYHTLIRGFCKLEQYDKAVRLLGEMKQYGVNPNHDEYNKLIKSLCLKALDWETAEKLEEDMRANGVILNGRTKALINAIKELKEEASAETSVPA